MSGRKRVRTPSRRYPSLIVAGRDAVNLSSARLACPGLQPVVWLHESTGITTAADFAAAFPGAERLSDGWRVDGRGDDRVHIACPAALGTFAGASAPEVLCDAVELWREHVGVAFAYSAASTLHRLIQFGDAVPDYDEPDPTPAGYQATAWAVRSHAWSGVENLEVAQAAGRRYVQCYDRSGSYLSAWAGISLPGGRWTHQASSVRAMAGPEAQKPAGYWLADPELLPDLGGMFDPWARQRGGPLWLTTPLVQLAVDIAGEPVVFREAWWAEAKCRPLDKAAAVCGDARKAFTADGSEAAGLALRALKDGYAGATAWFEYGPKPPKPLARPSWRHHVLDRYVANTWRALDKASPTPFALAEIDCALFVGDGEQRPDGLRRDGLGAWKAKGEPVPIGDADELYVSGGPSAVIERAEGRA